MHDAWRVFMDSQTVVIVQNLAQSCVQAAKVVPRRAVKRQLIYLVHNARAVPYQGITEPSEPQVGSEYCAQEIRPPAPRFRASLQFVHGTGKGNDVVLHDEKALSFVPDSM